MRLDSKLFVCSVLIWAAGTSAATPSSCKAKVFVDGYTTPQCVVPAAAGVTNLVTGLFLAAGDCKDTTTPVASFRHAISNDAFAPRCVLNYWLQKGCKEKISSVQAREERNFNPCVSVPGVVAVPGLTGAQSFSLTCS